ncbi:hypothetical protein R70723_26870 [Paenibacillus sp. FSL R7-0273]|uniref:hypothetical protein n=1 Tax=Paenibacillus sp. FSL R7-0273 TaxID=1536772 RepID=UPI0004F78811|nr:hypothetical protein [Paenibacillus sp. FSL R7-0273]AIQ49125.1 hypothetical protein R70723_26870 [Paenibacillus sp. FSL R7-0273]OMF87192.1 hypothetical protein BK144_24480 [Paenibacillus sp. FSL R7-0273]
MSNLIERFLDDEISSQELYDSIYDFVTSYHIRNGEFEGNYYIIKKMDKDNFFIFPENIFPDDHREIPSCISIYKDKLVDSINAHARKQALVVKK